MQPAAAVCSFWGLFRIFGVFSTWLLLTQLSSKGGLNGLFSVFFWSVVDLSWRCSKSLTSVGNYFLTFLWRSLVLEALFSPTSGGS